MSIFSSRALLALAMVFFVAASLLISPERLASIGIMDVSLRSEVPLTRETALFEIRAAKWIAGALGGILAVLAIVWPAVERSSLYQGFIEKDFFTTAVYEDLLTKVFDAGIFIILGLIFALFLYLGFGRTAFSSETLHFINREDGLLEGLSAVMLLCAGVLSACVAVACRNVSATRAAMHAFLAVLFVVMCGEEISWGQRVLGFETPEPLRDLNVQQEVNLHNMFGYVFDHLFILFFFVWGCVVPLLYATCKFFKQLFRAIGLPVPSIGLALGMFFISFVFQDQIIYSLFDGMKKLRPAEMREFLSAVAFALLMYQAYAGLVVKGGKSVAGVSLEP